MTPRVKFLNSTPINPPSAKLLSSTLFNAKGIFLVRDNASPIVNSETELGE